MREHSLVCNTGTRAARAGNSVLATAACLLQTDIGSRHAHFWHYFFSRFFATLMSLLARINRGHFDFSQLLRPSAYFALGIAVEGSGIHLNSSFEKPSGKELATKGESTSIYHRVMTHWPLRFSSSAL
jgi:hypothetical protein